ncbi:glycosyltransferase [Agromyces protaetiae]|uniref:glycosyltransferase n=1 Tax=Agromyces protaetiae TaxID=2509455 RepID=UPI0013E9D3A6|nr:glycosyltransferase [Agromyces protaetiae]
MTGSLLSPLGGAEQYCLALAERQAADGHDVTVVTGWIDEPVRERVAARGIRLEVVPGNRPYPPDRRGGSTLDRVRFHAAELLDSLVPNRVLRRLERGAFDVVHVHRFAGFGTAPLRVRSTRVVHTVHDYSLVDTSASLVRDGVPLEPGLGVQSARASLLARFLPRRLGLVFPSPRTLERHVEWGFPVERFDSAVVPHGWDLGTPDDSTAARTLETSGPETSVDLETSAAPVRFLFLGKLSDHKGVRLLLDAWGDGVDGATLAVGGDGDLAGAVADAADASGGTLASLGWLDADARRREFARADVLVFPSLWPENFPLVVAEAILSGIPVVTTDIASPPLVDDGRSGLVVAPNPIDLRWAIDRLTVDPALRATLSAGAAERSAALDLGAHAAELERRYSAVLHTL